jgi:molybdenum cofactor biosynthesis enzyme MoaA
MLIFGYLLLACGLNAMTDDGVFCTRPWADVYIDTPNHVAPCCRAWGLNVNSLREYWDHPETKKLRADMLAGVKNNRCEYCYKLEDRGFASARQNTPPLKIPLTLNTDGSAEFKLQNVELRFSNVCNFKCRTCHGGSSSALAIEEKKVKPIQFAFDDSKKLLSDVKEHLPTLSIVRFSGGEPLLHKEAWELLKCITEVSGITVDNKAQIDLTYNSNGSTLHFKHEIITHYWQKVQNVSLTLSLDAIGKKAEYWRKGTKWDIIEKNVRLLLPRYNVVKISIHATISWVNGLSILELIDWANEIGIDVAAISLSPCWGTFSIQHAPLELKQSIENELNVVIAKYPVLGASAIIDYMNLVGSNPTEFVKAISQLKRVDALRNESFAIAFPEHAHLYE